MPLPDRRDGRGTVQDVPPPVGLAGYFLFKTNRYTRNLIPTDMDIISHLISDIERTFAKDDLQSAPREVLESLIISVHDGLTQVRQQSN